MSSPQFDDHRVSDLLKRGEHILSAPRTKFYYIQFAETQRGGHFGLAQIERSTAEIEWLLIGCRIEVLYAPSNSEGEYKIRLVNRDGDAKEIDFTFADDIGRGTLRDKIGAFAEVSESGHTLKAIFNFITWLSKRPAEDAPTGAPSSIVQDALNGFVALRDALKKEHPEPRWCVDGILPEGSVLLSADPKTGKTWFALGIAVAVASGGKALGRVDVDPGNVLYVALEDGERRIQARLLDILDDGESAPGRMMLAYKLPKLNSGGLDTLRHWCVAHPEARLIVVDTLEKVRPPRGKSGGSVYSDDYNAVCGLTELAHEFRVTILIVHHNNKRPGADPLHRVSGSQGLTGAVDGVLVLSRKVNEPTASLHVQTRDTEDFDLTLAFDREVSSWVATDEVKEYRQSKIQREILELLKTHMELSPKSAAIELKRNRQAVSKAMNAMAADDLLTFRGATLDRTFSLAKKRQAGGSGNNSNGLFVAPSANGNRRQVNVENTDSSASLSPVCTEENAATHAQKLADVFNEILKSKHWSKAMATTLSNDISVDRILTMLEDGVTRFAQSEGD